MREKEQKGCAFHFSRTASSCSNAKYARILFSIMQGLGPWIRRHEATTIYEVRKRERRIQRERTANSSHQKKKTKNNRRNASKGPDIKGI